MQQPCSTSISSQISSGDGAKIAVLDQCMYGADSTKPTQLLYHFARFDGLETRCNHPVVCQHLPNGKEVWAAHPPSVGVKTNAGDFATKAVSAYPSQLNKAIADVISESLVDAC